MEKRVAQYMGMQGDELSSIWVFNKSSSVWVFNEYGYSRRSESHSMWVLKETSRAGFRYSTSRAGYGHSRSLAIQGETSRAFYWTQGDELSSIWVFTETLCRAVYKYSRSGVEQYMGIEG